MDGVENLTLAAAFARGQATYHQCQTGGPDEVSTDTQSTRNICDNNIFAFGTNGCRASGHSGTHRCTSPRLLLREPSGALDGCCRRC